ncbi:MAG: glycosyltransferase family 39 protein, partial [Candidatus Andersenbacteria bacterium]
MNRQAFWIGGIALVCIALFFIPVIQHRIVSPGIDSYVTHAPLFTGHIAEEQFTTHSKIIGIGTILVNLYHAKQLSDVHVTIFNTTTHEVIVSQIISPQDIHDDTFVYSNFKNTPIPANTAITVQYSAPSSTIKNPVGIRFGKTKSDLSLALVERVPVWKALLTIAHNRQHDWMYVAPFAGIALLLCLAVFNPFKKQYIYYIALGIALCCSYVIMLWIVPQFGGASGGDPYNYLSITQTIQHGQNPFLNSKRLLGYPILLVPTFASGLFDDQLVMRIMTSSFGIIAIIFLALIARQITSSWLVALASAIILAFQKDFIWTAMRPEPYAVYTALLCISLFLFFTCYKKQKVWIYILFGFFLGWSAMTRQEGFMLAVVLGICSLIYEIVRGKSWKRILAMYLPALLVISPFLITNFIQYQNPFHTQYLEGDRL